MRAGGAGQWLCHWAGPDYRGAQHGGLPLDGGDGEDGGGVNGRRRDGREDLELRRTNTHVRAHGHSPALPTQPSFLSICYPSSPSTPAINTVNRHETARQRRRSTLADRCQPCGATVVRDFGRSDSDSNGRHPWFTPHRLPWTNLVIFLLPARSPYSSFSLS